MTQNRELFTMKKIVLILILIVLLTGCSKSTPVGTQSGGETPTPDLAPPEVQTTQAPDVEETAIEFLEYWKSSDYLAMYSMLSPASQAAITEEDFSQIYHEVAVELAMDSLEYAILSSFVDPSQAQVVWCRKSGSDMRFGVGVRFFKSTM